MRAGRIVLSLAVTMLIAGFGEAQTPRVPVLAELFTSEGCNSCPPADRLLESLLHEQPVDDAYVVILSEHVTYWDHQGWKDPFASVQFTDRQKGYAFRFNLDSIYTPQLVIDGTRELVGSNKRSIERAVRDAARTQKPLLHVELGGLDAGLSVSASGPGLVAGLDHELWFAVTEDNLVVEVKRGENANRTLRHSGVVRRLQSAGSVDRDGINKGTTFTLDPGWRREHLRVVAFVQSRQTRKILSVGSTKL